MLRRIYNGRTIPIIVDGRSFLTYKEASRYLLSLTIEAREAAYAEMKGSATSGEKNAPPPITSDDDAN